MSGAPLTQPYNKAFELMSKNLSDLDNIKEEEVFTPETVELVKYTQRQNANPGIYGVLCFSTTAILLNLHNIGLYPLDTMCIGTGFLMGGVGQLFAGFIEYHKNNLFGMALLGGFGGFWLSLATMLTVGDFFPKTAALHPTTSTSMGFFFAVWTVIIGCFFFATLGKKGIHVIQCGIFGATLMFLFFSINAFTETAWTKVVAGVIGLITGIIAFYNGAADMVNSAWGFELLPVQIPLFDLRKVLATIRRVASENKKGEEQ